MSIAQRRRTSRRKIYDLDAPGMPFPGPDFIEQANHEGEPVAIKGKGREQALEAAGEVIQELYYKALCASGSFTLPIRLKADRRKTMRFIPGHLWGGDVHGPVPAEVMVLGKMPGKEEESRRRNLIGPSSQLLLDALRYLNVKGMRHWYVTNLLKFRHPEDGSTLKSPWIKDCLPLLHQELRLVRPKFILCLGADASKNLLGDKYSVAYMEGRVIPYQYPVHRAASDEPRFREALVMTCLHPAQVYRQPETASQMEYQLARFGQLIRGIRFDQAEEDIDHRVIRNEVELRALFAEIRATCRDRWIALDAEWNGEHPQNSNAYLRTVQLSWAHKKAACIVLRAQGGADSFRPSPQRAAKLLNEFLNEAGDWRICGQFLNADLEWLIHEGIDPRANFSAPEDWRLTRTEGGHDTGLAAHAIEETGDFGLESLSLRHTTAPRYDVALHDWREKFCKQHKLKAKDLEGYGECPEDILLPYGNYDADVTRRITLVQQQLLDRDPFDNNCREAFWVSMRAAPAVLEIHRTGIGLDRKKVDELTMTYLRARQRMERKIRRWSKWPDFNMNSVQQVREFLFGEQLNGKLSKDGKTVRIRPKGAVSLKLDPLLDTSKRPVSWKEIRERGEEGEHSPGTGKMILAIMAQESQSVPAVRKGKRVLVDYSQQINWIRDYRFISQVLKSTLRVPLLDESGTDWDFDDSGFMRYPDGLPAALCADGRVRTHIYQTKETGRWSSARPPLQNLCVDAETEYLTPRGWIPAPQFVPGEQLAQFDPATGHIEFVEPLEIHQSHFKGEMEHLRGEQFDLLVTPNHRCLLRRRRSGKLFEVPAEELPVGGEDQHLHAGIYINGEASLSWEQVAWVTAIQADGSYVNGFDGQGIAFTLSKTRKKKRLRAVLQALGAEWSERHRGVKTAFYVGVEKNRDLVELAKELLGPEKTFGPWLLDFDRSTLDHFVEEVLYWDGLWTRKSEYSSSEKANADWVQILWSLSGLRARQRLYRPANPRARDHYCVNIPIPNRRRDYTSLKKAQRKQIPWDGPVWCVSVPSEFIVVRRRGKVSITGNSKRREKDYRRILGDNYKYPLRSVICAGPGKVLVEADYIGAELFGMAVMSGDKQLIEHALRNQLPEDHPDFYDIHSNICVLAFRFNCPPTKKGLESIGKKEMRDVAKTVIFGIAYGRGAKAIALAVKEEGVYITVEEAQAVIDAVFQMYPGLVPFFDGCRARVQDPRWMCGCFGRFRRFSPTDDFMVLGEQERQAMNFPIQGMIADAVSRACDHLYYARPEFDADYRIVMQIHDAILLETTPECVPTVIEKVLPTCMSRRVPIYPCDLDGVPTGSGPHYLGIDTSICLNWGLKMTLDQCRELGVDPKYAGLKAA